MRVLLIAHDFPPVRSPQSIRAAAFADGLASLGAQVHVLSRSDATNLVVSTPGVVHRASAGLFEGALDRIAARKQVDEHATEGTDAPAWSGVYRLNWKGRMVRAARAFLEAALFPDARRLWLPDARRMLVTLLEEVRPDVAVIMHEPASALLLAPMLAKACVPWAADLADPVLAPYTRWWWRGGAGRLEAKVLHEAGHVLVSNQDTEALLRARHANDTTPITVVRQGFVAAPAQVPPASGDGLPLRLLYTGRFYSFRPVDALVAAVESTPGVHLSVAGPEVPEVLLRVCVRHPEKFSLLGELSHAKIRPLQERTDLLVNIANEGTAQTPGKFYEYLGACRPILHLSQDPGDSLGRLLLRLGRGVSCENHAEAIATVLKPLVLAKEQRRLDEGFVLDLASVCEFSWASNIGCLANLLDGLVKGRVAHP